MHIKYKYQLYLIPLDMKAVLFLQFQRLALYVLVCLLIQCTCTL